MAMEAVALGVGLLALPPLLKFGAEGWRFVDQVRMTSPTQELYRVRLNNQKKLFALWANRVGIACPSCYKTSQEIREVEYKKARLGKVSMFCKNCSKSFTRIAANQHQEGICQEVQDTLHQLGNMFNWTDEIAERHGFQRRLPANSRPAITNGRRRRRDRWRLIFGRSRGHPQVSSPPHEAHAEMCSNTVRWVVIDERRFKEFIDQITSLVSDLERLTDGVLDMTGRQRAILQLKNWWKDTAFGMKALERAKKQKMLLGGLDNRKAVNRVSALLVEHNRQSQLVAA